MFLRLSTEHIQSSNSIRPTILDEVSKIFDRRYKDNYLMSICEAKKLNMGKSAVNNIKSFTLTSFFRIHEIFNHKLFLIKKFAIILCY